MQYEYVSSFEQRNCLEHRLLIFVKIQFKLLTKCLITISKKYTLQNKTQNIKERESRRKSQTFVTRFYFSIST